MKQDPKHVRHLINILAIYEDFLSTYDIELLAGRNFSEHITADLAEAVIVNKSALKLLGLKDPEEAINKEIIMGDYTEKKIVGVISDFHQQSLKQPKKPIVFYYIPFKQDFITLSLNSADISTTLGVIRDTYLNAFPDNAFEYFFLDDHFNQQYKAEERSWKIFILFAVLAIVVGCMGLFGLSLFLTTQRAKEIAIRKVLGASVSMITLLLSKDLIKLMFFAFLLTIPMSWYVMNEWLKNFAYHINVPLWTFLFAGIITTLVALFTISFQTVKAALTNPIKAIKME